MQPGKLVFDKQASLVLKGIAIIMMMLHHNFRTPSLYSNYAISFYPFSESHVVTVASACKICVSIFAFITGYGLYASYSHNKISPTKWVFQRYVKTFSGYWFVWALSAIICQLIDRRTTTILFRDGTARGLFNALIDFLGLHNMFRTPSINGTWWYMSAAAVFILLIPLLYRFRDNIILIMISTVFLMRVIRNDSPFTGGNSTYAFLTPFMMGFAFSHYSVFEKLSHISKQNKLTTLYKAIAESWLIIAMLIVYNKVPIDMFWEYHFCLFPTLVICFCVEFVVNVKYLRNLLCFCGRHSMNIFFVHTFIRGYYLADFTYSFKHFAVVVLVLLCLSIAISMVIEQLKKLLRYNDLINNLANC